MTMLTVAQIISGFLILFTVFSLLARKEWWVKIFDFPKLQITSLLIVGVIVQIIWFEENPLFWIILSLSLVAIIVQVYYISPYFPFSRKEIPDSDSNTSTFISLLISNVQMSNRKSSKLKEHISRYSADIVLLVETDQWWKNEMDPVMSEYPYSVKVPLENTYGMLLYSKKPLNNTKVEYLIKQDVPSIHTEVEIDDCKISLSCLHPEPPAPTEADTSRPRDKELVVVAKKIKDLTLPCIALGDLNDVAWSDTSTQFTRISKMRDPRKGRGFFNTYNAKYPLLSWALDHVFLSNTFTVTELEKLSKIGSDHYPIYIKCGINKPD